MKQKYFLYSANTCTFDLNNNTYFFLKKKTDRSTLLESQA